jgi:ribosomal protein S12 methylthiotransferase accessory factor
MDIRVTFSGKARVDADFGTRIVHTDQSVMHGGDDTAPEPYDLFLAALATCAGVYVLKFCQARNIPTEAIELIQHHQFSETGHRLERVELELRLPRSFPDKYRGAVVAAANGCRVKKTLAAPEITVVAR